MTPCLWGARGKPGQRLQETSKVWPFPQLCPRVAGRSGAGALPRLPCRREGAGLALCALI